MTQPERIGLQNALLQEAGAQVEDDVGQVQSVGDVVEREPVVLRLGFYVVERETVDYHPEVVQKCQRDYKTCCNTK